MQNAGLYIFLGLSHRGRGWRGLLFQEAQESLALTDSAIFFALFSSSSCHCLFNSGHPAPSQEKALLHIQCADTLLGYGERRAQMCLQLHILVEIISSLSDVLLPYTPALGSGSH